MRMLKSGFFACVMLMCSSMAWCGYAAHDETMLNGAKSAVIASKANYDAIDVVAVEPAMTKQSEGWYMASRVLAKSHLASKGGKVGSDNRITLLAGITTMQRLPVLVKRHNKNDYYSGSYRLAYNGRLHISNKADSIGLLTRQ